MLRSGLAPVHGGLGLCEDNWIALLILGFDLADEHAVGRLHYKIGLIVLARAVLDLKLPFSRLDPFPHRWFALNQHRKPPLRIRVEFLQAVTALFKTAKHLLARLGS